jgi:hypothetical protein
MAGKKWADRLPLDDLRGCILFGAALWHLLKELQDQKAAFDDALASVGVKATQTKRQEGLIDSSAEIQAALERLGPTPSAWKAAKSLRFSDFIFFAEDLWARPYLTWFVVPRRSSGAPHVDQETPISRNRQAPLSDLCSLFEKWAQWHANPRVRGDLLDPAFGHLPEHFHFMNYVAEVCEPPLMGRPHGSGYADAAGSAAAYAWSLLYTADKEGRSLSVAEAVRKAVACFDIAPPTIDRKQRMVTGELEGTILASSMDQAEKRVRKLLEEIIAREPPWQMPSALTPWDH